MAKHTHTVISADQAPEVKKWRLPFWTDTPVWESEKIDNNIRRRSRVTIIPPTRPTPKPAPEPQANVSSEEINELALPTAEELEIIRREAYNEGLEQGLIEGRTAGHKEGFNQGQQEGHIQGLEAGTNEGYQAGFAEGEAAGLAKAQANTNMVVTRLLRVVETLNSRIAERDQAMPQVLATLVEDLCQQVLAQELSQGATAIYDYVQTALAQLPEGAENIQVFVGPDDAKHLKTSLEQLGQTLNYEVDASLPAGSCRVESTHSLVEYSSHERMQQLLAQAKQQLLSRAAEPEILPAEANDMPMPADNSAPSTQAELAKHAETLNQEASDAAE